MAKHVRDRHGPHPVDLHVGARLRQRRAFLGKSQTALAEALGLTFQQIQKYEKGQNRISASTLWRLAEALDCPVGFFFDGLEQGRAAPAVPDAIARETGQVVRDFAKIEHPLLRAQAAGAVKTARSLDVWLRAEAAVRMAARPASPPSEAPAAAE